MKGVDVVSVTDIAAPKNRVAEFAADPDNAPVWYVNIKSVQWKTIKPLTIGSQIAFVAHFMGRKLSYVYEVREFVPGEKLVMSTVDGPFPMETTYTWEIIDEHTTRMTLRNRGRPSGFSKLFAPLMSYMMLRANRKDLKLLKQILESEN
jgi:uncharacterized protein YndB with AHSA1/START domain